MALAKDGVASMIGFNHGLTTRLGHNVPTLVNTHCIAHQKALYAGDGFKTIT
jgi:hypothetical protein